MHRLEIYAKEKEQDKESLIKAATELLHEGKVNEKVLQKAINEAFMLGHHAGHCRGELSIIVGYGLEKREELA